MGCLLGSQFPVRGVEVVESYVDVALAVGGGVLLDPCKFADSVRS